MRKTKENLNELDRQRGEEKHEAARRRRRQMCCLQVLNSRNKFDFIIVCKRRRKMKRSTTRQMPKPLRMPVAQSHVFDYSTRFFQSRRAWGESGNFMPNKSHLAVVRLWFYRFHARLFGIIGTKRRESVSYQRDSSRVRRRSRVKYGERFDLINSRARNFQFSSVRHRFSRKYFQSNQSESLLPASDDNLWLEHGVSHSQGCAHDNWAGIRSL